jgi:hypothetical protein
MQMSVESTQPSAHPLSFTRDGGPPHQYLSDSRLESQTGTDWPTPTQPDFNLETDADNEANDVIAMQEAERYQGRKRSSNAGEPLDYLLLPPSTPELRLYIVSLSHREEWTCCVPRRTPVVCVALIISC